MVVSYPDDLRYSGEFLIRLADKESYLRRLPLIYKFDPQCKKESLKIDANVLEANTEELLDLLKL